MAERRMTRRTLTAMALAACHPEDRTAQPGAAASEFTSPNTPVGMGTWTVGTPPPADLYLELSKTTVHPGEIITRTIHGAHCSQLIGNDYRTDVVGTVMFLEQKINSTWLLVCYVGLGYNGQKPGNFLPGPNVAISAIGLSPEPATIKIPDLAPGIYRLREDVQREDDLTPLPATPSPPTRTYTHYATIRVDSATSVPTTP